LIVGDADVALEAERTGDVSALPVDEPSLTNWRAGLRTASSFSTLAVYGEDGDALFAPPGGSALLSAQSLPSVVRATIGSVATRGRLPYLGLRLRERLGWIEPRRQPDTPWMTGEARRLAASPEEATILGQPLQPLDLDPGNGRAWERLLRNVPRAFAISISPDVTRQRLALTLPLMDTRVIEFVMSVPPIPWCEDKRLARAAFAERLPSGVLTRRKTTADGLDAALVQSWRRQHLPAALHALTPALQGTGWVDNPCWADAVEHGSPRVTMAAWRVLLLDAWLGRTSRKVVPCIS
jgi:Asparagine synthase